MRSMHSLMTNCVDKLEMHFDSLLENDSSATIQNFKNVIAGFTIDVIASTSFATNTDSNGPQSEKSPFVQNGKKFFRFNPFRVFVCFFLSKFLLRLLNIKTVFSPKAFDFFINLTQEIVKQRKTSGVKRNDFVQLLLDSEIEEGQLTNIDYNKLTMEKGK